MKHSVILFFIIKSFVMSPISVSVHQHYLSFSIFLFATTANGVVFLPITLQQLKSLFGSCIGCSIQPGQAYLLVKMLAILAPRGLFLDPIQNFTKSVFIKSLYKQHLLLYNPYTMVFTFAIACRYK